MERPEQITPTLPSTPSTGDEATRPADPRDPASPASLDLRRPTALRAHWLFMGLACLVAAGGFVAGLVSLVGLAAVAWPALALLAVALAGGLMLPALTRAVAASLERRGLLATGWRAGLHRRLRPFAWLFRGAACVALAGLLGGIGGRAHIASIVDDYLAEVERLDKRGTLLSTENGGDARQRVLALGTQAVPWLIRADQGLPHGVKQGAIRRVLVEVGLPAVPALADASRGDGRYHDEIWRIAENARNRSPEGWEKLVEALTPHIVHAFIGQLRKRAWSRDGHSPQWKDSFRYLMKRLSPAIILAIFNLLETGSDDECREASYCLMLHRSGLEHVLASENPTVRVRAVAGWEMLARRGFGNSYSAVEHLAAVAAKSSEESNRWMALMALKEIGPRAWNARGALIRLCKEGRTMTDRTLAAEALAAIGE